METLFFFDDYDELYYKLNESQIKVSTGKTRKDLYQNILETRFESKVWIDSIIAKIQLPKKAKPIKQQINLKDSTVGKLLVEQNSIIFKHKYKELKNNLEIVVSFQKNIVTKPESTIFFEEYKLVVISIIAGILLFLYYFVTWLLFGKDPEKPAVYPQFHPPENLSPAAIGMIYKEKYWSGLLISSVVNLIPNKS